MLSEIAGFGFRFYPAAVAHALDFNAGVLVLAAIASSSEVGIYAALSALMLRFLLLAQAIQEAVLPRVAADADRGRQHLVSQLTRVSVWATAAIVLAFLPVSNWIVGVLLSPPFVEGISIIWWMVPGIIAHAASAVLMPYFEGRGRPGVVSIATWVGMTVNVAAVVLLYPVLGLPGAGLAMTLGLVSRFAVLCFHFSGSGGGGFWALLTPRKADIALASSAIRGVIRRVGYR
jgi:O-antigen/teichoic acid export membrane protein